MVRTHDCKFVSEFRSYRISILYCAYLKYSNFFLYSANAANDKETLLINAIKYVTNFFESLSFENTTELRGNQLNGHN